MLTLDFLLPYICFSIKASFSGQGVSATLVINWGGTAVGAQQASSVYTYIKQYNIFAVRLAVVNTVTTLNTTSVVYIKYNNTRSQIVLIT